MIGIYAENFSIPDSPFSVEKVLFSRTAVRVTFYPTLYILRVLLAYSCSSADIIFNVIKLLFLQIF